MRRPAGIYPRPCSATSREGSAHPEDLHILRVQGDSMAPLPREGDRLLVDIAHRTQATGEMVVLQNGTGLLAKRTEDRP